MTAQPTGRYVTTSVASESFTAFVPEPLPPELMVKERGTLDGPLRKAGAALARLDLASEMMPSLDGFIYAVVLMEALLSSEMEGAQATLVEVLAWEQTNQAGDSRIEDIEEVTNYVAAINHAVEQIHSPKGAPISFRLFNDCHRILMEGVRGANKRPGELRCSQRRPPNPARNARRHCRRHPALRATVRAPGHHHAPRDPAALHNQADRRQGDWNADRREYSCRGGGAQTGSAVAVPELSPTAGIVLRQRR